MIELKNKFFSPKSVSIYYDVFLNGEFKCKLRISDHVHVKQNKYLFFWSYNPKKVKLNVLLNFVEEQFKRKDKFHLSQTFIDPIFKIKRKV